MMIGSGGLALVFLLVILTVVSILWRQRLAPWIAGAGVALFVCLVVSLMLQTTFPYYRAFLVAVVLCVAGGTGVVVRLIRRLMRRMQGGQPAEHSARLIKSHAEARHMLDDLASTGRAMLPEIDRASYKSWHERARTTLARIFDTRTVVQDFEMAGSGSMKLSESHARDTGPIEDRIQGELDYLDRLIEKLPSFPRIGRAIR